MTQAYEFQLIKRPGTKDEHQHNKRIYNQRMVAVRSVLRDHLNELDLTEDQHEWLNGSLKVTNGSQEFTASLYCQVKRKKEHQLVKR